jgi:hypothetical protein
MILYVRSFSDRIFELGSYLQPSPIHFEELVRTLQNQDRRNLFHHGELFLLNDDFQFCLMYYLKMNRLLKVQELILKLPQKYMLFIFSEPVKFVAFLIL